MAGNWNPLLGGSPLYLAQTTGPRKPPATTQSGPVFKVEDPEPNTLEKFEVSIKEFQESLKDLTPIQKQDIRQIHEEVRVWHEKEIAAGRKADKLATFTGRVMEYCNKALESIENSDPHLTRRKAEFDVLNKIFYKGEALINAYHAYVKDKSMP